MEKVKIIIDSSSDLTFDEIEKYNVEVIPLTINIDGNEYDYRTISNDEYIERMRTATTYSTSQPAIGKFLEAYEKEERYKTDTYLLSSIGKMYDLLGKYENGEEFLRKSYDLGERDRWINMELGECLTRLGKYEEAIEKLLEARRLYMAEGKAPYSEDLELAYCYAALGDKEKAKYHMDSSIEALGAYVESEEYLKKRFTEIKEMINSLK